MFKIAVLYGHGINCDRETKLAFERIFEEREDRSGTVERVHTNDFIRGKEKLNDYQMLVIPGGFLHGDDISAGKILANKLKTKLSRSLEDFVESDKLILGICNGFQVLAKYSILPSLGDQEVSLTWNNSGRFVDRWVHLKANKKSPCIYLDGIDSLYLPVRHAEGRFVTDDETLNDLERNNLITLKYIKPDGSPANGKKPYNPNGSMKDIAGICDSSGRIFGLMPHPEAYHSLFNRPNWTNINGKEEPLGLKIFENSIDFLQNKFH